MQRRKKRNRPTPKLEQLETRTLLSTLYAQEIGSRIRVTGEDFEPGPIALSAEQNGQVLAQETDLVNRTGKFRDTIRLSKPLEPGHVKITAKAADGAIEQIFLSVGSSRFPKLTTTLRLNDQTSTGDSNNEVIVTKSRSGQSTHLNITIQPTYDHLSGKLERESLAAYATRPITDGQEISRTGKTYFDESFRIDVEAPDGFYFVEYVGAVVDIRPIPTNLPPGKAHPTKDEVQPIPRTGFHAGTVSKPVIDTVKTVFSDHRGIDVPAQDGFYFVVFADHSIAEYPLPPGGFVPRPGDFTVDVSANDTSRSIEHFGPTAEELGLVSSDNNQPKPSENLVLIGTSYDASNGEHRQAPRDQVYVRDLESGTILLRPATDADKAIQPASESYQHPAGEVADLFYQVYGRDPSSTELAYWASRTDKSGAALLGAMQHAYRQSDRPSQSNYTQPALHRLLNSTRPTHISLQRDAEDQSPADRVIESPGHSDRTYDIGSICAAGSLLSFLKGEPTHAVEITCLTYDILSANDLSDAVSVATVSAAEIFIGTTLAKVAGVSCTNPVTCTMGGSLPLAYLALTQTPEYKSERADLIESIDAVLESATRSLQETVQQRLEAINKRWRVRPSLIHRVIR